MGMEERKKLGVGAGPGAGWPDVRCCFQFNYRVLAG
jgi:hypothetical protein